jgi:hypothetical protein
MGDLASLSAKVAINANAHLRLHLIKIVSSISGGKDFRFRNSLAYLPWW